MTILSQNNLGNSLIYSNGNYLQSLIEDQKRIEDIKNFHHLLREFLSYLNQKLKTPKERISKFRKETKQMPYLKFD